MTKFFIDCENTMTVCAVKKLKGHTGRTFLGILHTASGAEAAFAAEGNKFHVVASGADIHGTAKRRIATIQHFIDIFHLRISGMKSVFDYFIIVIKDFLQDIHNVIMREREEKRKPHPSRLRGRGVEVSKTLFYQEFDECRTFLLYKKKKPLTRYLLTHQQLLSCFVSVYYSVLFRLFTIFNTVVIIHIHAEFYRGIWFSVAQEAHSLHMC